MLDDGRMFGRVSRRTVICPLERITVVGDEIGFISRHFNGEAKSSGLPEFMLRQLKPSGKDHFMMRA